MPLLDLTADHRARTRFSDGADTVYDALLAAEQAGLASLVIADRVDAGTDWLPAYSKSVDRARERTGIRLYCGVAADITGIDGTLDAPVKLPGIEQLTVISRQFLLPGGAVTPAQVRALLEAGRLQRRTVLECLVVSYVNALRQAGERAQAVLARPFSLLPEAGLREADLDGELVRALADGCRAAGAMVEVNERLSCPSPQVAAALVAAGVRLAAGSDAYRARDIGRWTYARDIQDSLPAGALETA
jgi:putative hydrolase